MTNGQSPQDAKHLKNMTVTNVADLILHKVRQSFPVLPHIHEDYVALGQLIEELIRGQQVKAVEEYKHESLLNVIEFMGYPVSFWKELFLACESSTPNGTELINEILKTRDSVKRLELAYLESIQKHITCECLTTAFQSYKKGYYHDKNIEELKQDV